MQQVIVDVIDTQTLEGGVEARFGGRGVGLRPGQALRRDGVRVARVAIDERLLQGRLRHAVVVHVRRVEVRVARRHENIDHLLELLDVDGFRVFRVEQRQPHASEAHFRFGENIRSHGGPLSFFNSTCRS